MPRLTEKSPAIVKLRELFESGQLPGQESPESVWQSEPLFLEHLLQTFRTRYNRIRKEYLDDTGSIRHGGSSGKQDTDALLLDRKCTVVPSVKLINPNTTGSVHIDESETNQEDLGFNQQTFYPCHLISGWQEDSTTTNRLSVAVLMPTGVDENYKIMVENGGRYRRFEIIWPQALLDTHLLHKSWLESEKESERFQAYHPKVHGF